MGTDQLLSLAEDLGVTLRYYEIIYDLIEDLKTEIEEKLPPIIHETLIGTAKVMAVFACTRYTETRTVAGCLVETGSIVKGSKCEVRRDARIIHDDTIDSLRRVKENVQTVDAGTECGIDIAGSIEWEVGDTILCYEVSAQKQTL